MKNKLLFTLIVFALIAANAFAQTKETRDVGTFTKISFRTPGTLYLKQGSPQKVEIEGSADILSKISTEVINGKLTIEIPGKWSNRSWRNDERINIYVTVKDIDAVGVGGSGEVIAQTKLVGAGFDFNVSGSGSMTAEVEASGKVNGNLSGSGGLELKGNFQSFESDISGSGDLKVSASIIETAEFRVSGSGKAKASGTAKSVRATLSGSGKVLAADLETEKCDIRISGSGDVEINVKNELDASISGSGSVSYKGNPSHVNSHASGSGHVEKMN